MNRSDERAFALAGTLQACYLVTGIARSGLVAEDSLAGSLDTIFVTNPQKTIEVYQAGNGVRTGLRLVNELLGDFEISEHGDTIRYLIAVLALEKKLRAAPELMRELGAGISAIQEHRRLHGAGVTSDDVIARLSALYERTAGTITPRISVQGTQKLLNNPTNTGRIRALLLAALRSAVLWRQLDGRMTQLILGRRRLLNSVNNASQYLQ